MKTQTLEELNKLDKKDWPNIIFDRNGDKWVKVNGLIGDSGYSTVHYELEDNDLPLNYVGLENGNL